jgi:DNA-binding CsgD family transcriptional regulator
MQTALACIITAIGSADFPTITAQALSRALDFEWAAIILHAGSAAPEALHDGLTLIGCGAGMRNYLDNTHRMNPMLRAARPEAVRASDYATRLRPDLTCAQDCLIWTDDEELGFRTRGWPERQEEIGLYVSAAGGIIELSLYRERRRARAPDAHLIALSAIGHPLAAAFRRHAMLSCAAPGDRLSAREREVHHLIVRGCSTEAVALRLGISRHTVKDHRKRIFSKLGVGSLAELMARHWAPGSYPSPEGLPLSSTTEH